ncbi:hypothetical protein ACA910_009917 [Epithemia clementina (nom. ined.)]
MQFQFNADYPGVGPDGTITYVEPKNPQDFPPAQPIPCARITTRVFHPNRNQVATVQNVLVRTDLSALVGSSRGGSAAGGAAATLAASGADHEEVSWSSDDMSSTSSDASMVDGSNNNNNGPQQPPRAGGASQQQPPLLDEPETDEVRAYWVQRTVREAIYGRVLFAVVLRRRTPTSAPNDNAEWEVTNHHCAVKEMSWQHIRRERDRLAEDPIKEVSAMQYLKRWHKYLRQLRNSTTPTTMPMINNNSYVATPVAPASITTSATLDGVMQSFQAILETNIMMPLDLLSDDRHLYSIMPYCDGGELFERLDLNERFTEAEARYWMLQILNGLENLQNAGITHRDMSLENLLVHQSGALIIDMGMCLRVPFDEEINVNLSASFGNMNMNGGAVDLSAINTTQQEAASVFAGAGRRRPRHLIIPQGTCGKWIYMSPEIYKNQKPFDGFAVDMWAAGVILFLMLTGFPPWERACLTDERFKYMTAGYLVQMLTEWEVGLTSDAMDLLQRMLFLDPKDRLSLDQVRAHPWIVNGPIQPPGLGDI